MSYYTILTHIEERKYRVENLVNGRVRTMQLIYNDIIRLSNSCCQIISGISAPGYSYASLELKFVGSSSDSRVYPIEQKLHNVNDVNRLNQGDVIEVQLTTGDTNIYGIESIIPKQDSTDFIVSEIILRKIGDTTNITVPLAELESVQIKVLEEGYSVLQSDELVVKNSNGDYFQHSRVAEHIHYDTILQPGQIISVNDKDFFTLQEIANELGTNISDVKINLENILPDGKNRGVGINRNIIEQRRKVVNGEIDENNIQLSKEEFYRLWQYLNRSDTKDKSIVHWEFYVKRKYPNLRVPRYLSSFLNLQNVGIPYQHLDMERFSNIIDWIKGRNGVLENIESFFSYFHLLYWSEQISFIKKIIIQHKLGICKINNLSSLNQLIKHPKFININALILIHLILKLSTDNDVLSNLELYDIWKTCFPYKTEEEPWLALEKYIGTNLFCICEGAIGFNREDWWKDSRYNSSNKPVFYFFNNNREILLARVPDNHNNEIRPLMEDARKHRGFVIFRDDDNRTSDECFRQGRCPVVDAVYADEEYRTKLGLEPATSSMNGNNVYDCYLPFDNCPLTSVPSWRLNIAQKYKDRCTALEAPQSTIWIWYNRNSSLKHPFFCEGRLSVRPHQTAGLHYNWCNGNCCFTDIYVIPDTSNNAEITEKDINIYTAVIFLNICSNPTEWREKLIKFHSRLNWLNYAGPHFYCTCCNHILEAKIFQPRLNAHAVTKFECQINGCEKQGSEIYINHCWNDKCRSIIDSRETVKCPNGKYICPSCGRCCGQQMLERTRQAVAGNSSLPNYHFERQEFYCYKCGAKMVRQGNRYYCEQHPDVVTLNGRR